MKLSVVGTGYVGLVSGVCFSRIGHEVICVDNDLAKLEKIRSGVPPIHENGLQDALDEALKAHFTVTSNLAEAVTNTDVTFIAVGTPFDGKTIDLSFVENVAAQIGRALAEKKSHHLVVVKSTVVPGTTDTFVREIIERESGKTAGKEFSLGMNPEFLTEGDALEDFMNPDRIVVGGTNEKAIEILARVYETFEDVPVIKTNTRTAEMIKYASNALLATMISFSNEIANLGEGVGGIDSVDVMNGVHLSSYLTTSVGGNKYEKAAITSFLEAGCGFGGSCLPKDVLALVAQGRSIGVNMGLLAEVIRVNRSQPSRLVRKLLGKIPDLRKKRIGVMGLAFKPDTDDLRETPALPIIEELLSLDASVFAYDPIAMPAARQQFGHLDISYVESLKELVQRTDALLLVTRWDEFEKLPELVQLRESPIPLIDGRRMLNKSDFLTYDGIGLG